MSILDKASLVQIPSGYKNGKLYSVKPTPTYGSELVTNGGFDTDSDWSDVNNVSTITGGKLVFNNSTVGGKYQSTSMVIGKLYKLTYTIVSISNGYIQPRLGDTGYATQRTSAGTYSENIVCLSDTILRVYGGTSDGVVDNVSVKEITNIGDFDFSRSSSATRVNSEGLIETASVLGSEEVTNGDFSGGTTGWNLIGPGDETVVNGQLILRNTGRVRQDNVVDTNKTYKGEITVSGITNGSIDFYIGSTIALTVNSNGVHTFTVENPANTSIYIYDNGDSWDGYIDNVSVKEVIENDVPRLDYSDGASCASLLLEPQSTNLYLNSEPTANEGPAGNISYVGTSFGLGFNNYTYYSDNSVARYRYGGTCAATTEYTLSVFVIMDDNSSPNVSESSSLGDFSIIIAGTAATPISVTHYGNNIYRVIAKRTTGSSTLGNNGILKYTGQSSVGFKAVGWQLEAGSYATSYIPTSGSIVTRTADVCNNAGTSATFNDSEGVLFFEGARLNEADNSSIIWSISDGSNSNAVSLYYYSSGIGVDIFNTLGTKSLSYTMTLNQQATFNKLAIKYKSNDIALWVNGSEVATNTDAISLSGLNQLMASYGSGSFPFYGNTKQLMTFNEALSDEELSDLTGQVNLSFNNLATFYNYTIL